MFMLLWLTIMYKQILHGLAHFQCEEYTLKVDFGKDIDLYRKIVSYRQMLRKKF